MARRNFDDGERSVASAELEAGRGAFVLFSLLWPHPVAWGGLAAIWIFILAVNFSMRDQAPVMAEKTSPPSLEVAAELKQQQRLYAELIGITGTGDSSDADRPKVFIPKPRSERADILTA